MDFHPSTHWACLVLNSIWRQAPGGFWFCVPSVCDAWWANLQRTFSFLLPADSTLPQEMANLRKQDLRGEILRILLEPVPRWPGHLAPRDESTLGGLESRPTETAAEKPGFPSMPKTELRCAPVVPSARARRPVEFPESRMIPSSFCPLPRAAWPQAASRCHSTPSHARTNVDSDEAPRLEPGKCPEPCERANATLADVVDASAVVGSNQRGTSSH